jgi:hypothetical protein
VEIKHFFAPFRHFAAQQSTKFYPYAHTKLCGLITSLVRVSFLPKNRATQHESQVKQQYYG